MLIETWIFVVLVIYIFASGLMSLLGWMRADKMLELERDINNELKDEITYLTEENARLNSKISIAKLYIEEKTK